MENFKEVFRRDLYQVFLFSCPASLPFSVGRHAWFVINKKGSCARFEVIWRKNRGGTSWGYLHRDLYTPTQGIPKFFFSHEIVWKHPYLHGVLDGEENSLASQMIEFIMQSPEQYPYSENYSLLGPNSNTYVQWILDTFPECELQLPWNAFGKDFLR